MSDFTGLLPENDKQKAARKAMLLPMPPCAPGDLVEETLWEEFPPHLIAMQQGGTSSCAGYAEAHAWMQAVYAQTGVVPSVSAWFSYIEGQRFGGNIGSDSGAFLTSVLAAAKERGHCRKELAPNTGRYYTQISAAAYEDAKSKRVSRSVDLEQGGYDALRQVLGQQLGAAVFAVGWPLQFSQSGRVEIYRPGRWGHAMAWISLSTRKDSRGRPYVWCINSHPTNTYYEMSPDAIDSIISTSDWGCYAVCASDQPKPKVDWRNSNFLMA